jgi:hypothetical protein
MDNTCDKNSEETEPFKDYLKAEILNLEKAELTHVELEFENYKVLHPKQ